jgi:putative MFS transporter
MPGAQSVAQRLDALPLGRFHRRLVALAGLGWMFDAMDVGLVSFVLPVLAAAWALTPWQIGWGASMTLIGMLAGAVASGALADRWGRRSVFMGTLVLYGAASALCGLAPGYRSFLALRFLVGLGLGGELPVAAAYVAEFSPRLQRGRLVIFLDTFWSFGWALAAVLAYVCVPRWGWRSVFFLGGLPAFYALELRRSLPESPRFLTSAGRHAEAEAVVRAVEAECGQPAAELAPRADGAPEPAGSVADLWRAGAARQTLMLWILWFVMGYTYFGIYSWLPTLLVASGHGLVKTFGYTLLISLAQAPGFASAALCVERWGRIATLTAYRLLLAVACFFFGYAASSPAQIMFWGALISFFGMGSWGVAYAYTAESYPTRLRATGGGWATAMARVGGILAPLSIGWIMGATGSQRLVFWSMTAVTVVGVAAVLLLGRETRGLSLETAPAGT